jgi:hypothetical protein
MCLYRFMENTLYLDTYICQFGGNINRKSKQEINLNKKRSKG